MKKHWLETVCGCVDRSYIGEHTKLYTQVGPLECEYTGVESGEGVDWTLHDQARGRWEAYS